MNMKNRIQFIDNTQHFQPFWIFIVKIFEQAHRDHKIVRDTSTFFGFQIRGKKGDEFVNIAWERMMTNKALKRE